MKDNIKLLTGLRGLAALIVFISHSANQGPLPNIFGQGFGQFGVMLFFVLSGFLMGYLYLGKSFNKENVSNFLIARMARIFPLYFLLLIAAYLIYTFINNDFFYKIDSLSIIVKALLFIEGPQTFWTIPIEVQFYIYFVLVWYLIDCKKCLPITILSFVTFLLLILTLYGSSTFPKHLFGYSYSFVVGLIFSVFHSKNDNQGGSKFIMILGGLSFFCLFLNLPVIRLHYGFVLSQNIYLRTWLDPLNWGIILLLFYCALKGSKGLGFLSYPFFEYLGKISYGFYLTHYPCIYFFKNTELPDVFKVSLSFFLTLLISHILYIYFELPTSKKIKKIKFF